MTKEHRDLWEEAEYQVEQERKRDNLTFFLLLAALTWPFFVVALIKGF